MARYSALERVTMSAYRSLASVRQALPRERDIYDQFVMTVTKVEDLRTHVRRITVSAPELTSFRLLGPDEYFGLIMAPHRGDLVMPTADKINVRAALQSIDEDRRPDIRWYTVRAHRPETAEMDIDIVTHGMSGPGSSWALRAEEGLSVGFRAGSASYQPPADGQSHVLIADETALPALAAMADAMRDDREACSRVRAFVEVPDADHATPFTAPFECTTLTRGDDTPGSHLVPHIEQTITEAPTYAWACGESALATGARRHLVKGLKMPRRSVMFSGYWKLGVART